MAVHPQILYPEDATTEELEVLQKHERSLIDNLVKITGTRNERYTWSKSGEVFTLKCDANQRVVCAKYFQALRHNTPDQLIDDVTIEHLKPLQ